MIDKEKYPNLYKFDGEISSFALRIIKYDDFLLKKEKIIDEINKIQLSDDVIKEVINLTLEFGELKLETLIKDLNHCFNFSNNYNFLGYSKSIKFNNIDDIVKYVRENKKTYNILTRFIDELFIWQRTLSKDDFYFKVYKKTAFKNIRFAEIIDKLYKIC
ncbi:MAG: hypothetical protein IKT40_11860 [Bacilli bacterium]|nr:hypothetical protein [Bacilli bacterium]